MVCFCFRKDALILKSRLELIHIEKKRERVWSVRSLNRDDRTMEI